METLPHHKSTAIICETAPKMTPPVVKYRYTMPSQHQKGTKMMQPEPFNMICPKCGYSKKVTPRSDAIGIEMIQQCPKCQTYMERKEIQESSFFGKLFGK